jgi:hypothetical protein
MRLRQGIGQWRKYDLARLAPQRDRGARLTVFDMATRGERRIAGTSQGDWPYAFAARSGLFIWFTRNACGDELMSEQDEDAPGHFCLSHLPKQAESK